MNFLEKLDYLMNKNNLNKSTLSKSCNIPYTTIDGWYKKGYAGLKLTTLRKLSDFFGTSLDYWATENDDQIDPEPKRADMQNREYQLCNKEKKLISDFRTLNEQGQDYILQTMDMVKDKYKKSDMFSDMEDII